MLVVVKDRDVEHLLKPLLNFEAFRSLYVFKIDATKRRRNRCSNRNNIINGRRVDTHRIRIDTCELLEEHRLTFHHRHRRFGTNVT